MTATRLNPWRRMLETTWCVRGEIERLWVTEVDRESLGLQHAKEREIRRREGAMGVSNVGLSKEGIETDAKKQSRNYKVAMSSDRGGWLVAARLVILKTRQIYERDTRAFEVRAAKMPTMPSPSPLTTQACSRNARTLYFSSYDRSSRA